MKDSTIIRIILKNLILFSSLLVLNTNEGFTYESIKPRVSDKKINNLPEQESEIKIKKELDIKVADIQDLIELNNLELKNYQLKIDQNKSLLRSSISLWYPSLNLTSNGLPKYIDGYTNNDNDESKDTLSQQISASLSAEIKWDIINPSRQQEINIAKEEFERSQYAYLIKLRDIKLQAKKEFYLLQKNYQDVKVAKKALNYSNMNLNEAKVRFNNGVGTRLEVLEAKTQLSRDRQLLSNKLGNQKIQQRYLAEILNLPPTITPIISSKPKINGIWDKSLERSIISAFSYRRALDQILLDISINNRNASSALAKKYPTISIFNTLSKSFFEGQTLVQSPDMNQTSSSLTNSIGLRATWKLIDGGKAKALYKYNKSKAEEARNNFSLQMGKIRKQVEESFYKLEAAKENILATYQAKLSAKESLRLANIRFKSGITTQREIVNQQRDLTEAEVNHNKSITDYNIHLSELKRQTGINQIQYCLKNKNYSDNINQKNGNLNIDQSNITTICNQLSI